MSELNSNGCPAVRYDGEDVLLDLADGSTVRLDLRNYDTGVSLDHSWDGGGEKVWLPEDGDTLIVGLDRVENDE